VGAVKHATTKPNAHLENVTVTTADGRVFDLGNPNSKLFRLRIWRYQMQRRQERKG
jgi:hypothetical protein